jgi:hypothetical protein
MTGAEFMQPAFRFLDDAIREHGDYLYMGLVYASLPLIGWILTGGLRRKSSRPVSTAPLTIIVIRPPPQPPPSPPPVIGREPDPFSDDDGDSFAA